MHVYNIIKKYSQAFQDVTFYDPQLDKIALGCFTTKLPTSYNYKQKG